MEETSWLSTPPLFRFVTAMGQLREGQPSEMESRWTKPREERTHVSGSRAVRASRKVGGDCRRSRRKMVQRSSVIHQAPGKGTRSRGTRGFEKTRRTSWRLRWCGLLTCAAARAFAASLLERRPAEGADGEAPSVEEVLNDCRFVGLELAA